MAGQATKHLTVRNFSLVLLVASCFPYKVELHPLFLFCSVRIIKRASSAFTQLSHSLDVAIANFHREIHSD
ncbi:hypothetical protein CCHR01_09587 [Colletotrichum chrysophilum]|uniref:Secreted protein n=1 Tax=Colletotrichum chrysophilum TaxID=1836956 RepID=A0AAD9EE25_9PEZI|nr:hypothetical protein K456DRAFT_1411592 [Colletotrichum gloeosporioides 23]KAK1847799.1 hypothetical protein CCHR01_09587 [Colletotrichum chrysophilum]